MRETQGVAFELRQTNWEVPSFHALELAPKRSSLCVCVPVINEGERIRRQLGRMRDIVKPYDVLIADGYKIKDGLATVPESPGFGLKIDEAKFARQVKVSFDLKAG